MPTVVFQDRTRLLDVTTIALLSSGPILSLHTLRTGGGWADALLVLVIMGIAGAAAFVGWRDCPPAVHVSTDGVCQSGVYLRWSDIQTIEVGQAGLAWTYIVSGRTPGGSVEFVMFDRRLRGHRRLARLLDERSGVNPEFELGADDGFRH